MSCQLVSTALRALSARSALRASLSACQLLPPRPCPGAQEVPLPAAVGSYARGGASRRLTDMLTSGGEAGAC